MVYSDGGCEVLCLGYFFLSIFIFSSPPSLSLSLFLYLFISFPTPPPPPFLSLSIYISIYIPFYQLQEGVETLSLQQVMHIDNSTQTVERLGTVDSKLIAVPDLEGMFIQ